MSINDLEGLDETARKEIKELQKITREKDGNDAYINAQFELERHMASNGEFELGIKCLRNIKK